MMTPAEKMTKDDERLMLVAYDDATGKPLRKGDVVKGNVTLGWGTLISAPGGIDQAEAQYLFDRRWKRAEREASTFKWFFALDEVRQDVCVMMIFNMGMGDEKRGFKSFKRLINALDDQDFERAADEMLASKWRTEVGERALRLSEMMRTGEYPKG